MQINFLGNRLAGEFYSFTFEQIPLSSPDERVGAHSGGALGGAIAALTCAPRRMRVPRLWPSFETPRSLSSGAHSRDSLAAPQDDGPRVQYTSCWNRPFFLSSPTNKTAS